LKSLLPIQSCSLLGVRAKQSRSELIATLFVVLSFSKFQVAMVDPLF
jgi:hypothetical protein